MEIFPLTVTIGAEIAGLDLASVTDEQLDALRGAWLRHKVLFFRDQHISRHEHIAIGARLGELDIQEYGEVPGHPELLEIDSTPERPVAAVQWHSDVTWSERPPIGSLLRATLVPPVGGDTLFANAAASYERLSPEWKQRLDGLTAVHDRLLPFGRRWTPEEIEAKRPGYPLRRHPVVREHPETGEKVIYTNPTFTTHVEGVSAETSREILRHLERAIADPAVQCRFRWQKDSFALWDNRCVQHCVSNDFWPERRTVERVTINGSPRYRSELVANPDAEPADGPTLG